MADLIQEPKIIQVADFKRHMGDKWSECKECKEWIFTDVTGKQYYHRIKCSKSNGIKYKKDR